MDWLRNYGLVGRWNLNNMTVVLQVCQAWSNVVANEKFAKKVAASRRDLQELASITREQGLEYMLIKQAACLVEQCLCIWAATVGKGRLEKKIAETGAKLVDARCAASRTLARIFGGDSSKMNHALLDEVFIYWAQILREARLASQLEDERQAASAAAEKHKEEKMKMAERFGKVAMAQMEKQLSAGSGAIKQTVFAEWLNVMKFEKERDRAQEALRASKIKAIEMALGKNGAKLLEQAFYELVSAIRDEKINKKKREEAMAKGLRAISGGEYATKNLFFDSWGKVMVETRAEREREKLLEEQRAAQIKARAEKLKAVQGALASQGKMLLHEVCDKWALEVKNTKKRERLKQGVLRGIAGEADMIKSGVFFEWVKMTADDRELAQERGRRRRLAELGRAYIIKLREHIIVRAAWDGWLIRTLI
jgi:hypothetical protein